MFDNKDQEQIAQHGSELATVNAQIENFKKGFPFLDIQRAAGIGDGIKQLSQTELDQLVATYDEQVRGKNISKFVPASGAATRMFKNLFAYLDDPSGENEAVTQFIAGIKDFAFYDELNNALEKKGKSIDQCLADKDYVSIIGTLLLEEGLAYGKLPKALLSFHQYAKGPRTPLEEHLIEGANYAKSENGQVNLHFTVSAEHQAKFEELVGAVSAHYEAAHGVKYAITFSQQKKSTDTIAVDMDNEPFREEDGSLLFRPAGHGALLENLNDLDADLIYIKNIDNVAPDRLKEDTFNYKRALGALLLSCQEEVHAYLKEGISDPDACAAAILEKYYLEMPAEFQNLDDDGKRKILTDKLNRPIRVCGMVKNTGEPGGGPFWVVNEDGSKGLQIAETAQIDLDDPAKAEMLKSATHFNPVDLVCCTKDYQGKKYDLLDYRDDDTGFISLKSKSGKDLKAMELPGLWNGAMANWITFFVEVPISTFSPVKTVNDLLKPVHQ